MRSAPAFIPFATSVFAASVLAASMLASCASAPPAPSAESARPASEARTFTSVIDGSPAPEFTLERALEPGTISLADLEGKPTVLIFGSCTCPPFVESLLNLNAIHRDYGDRVNFLLVYIREAHPTDGGGATIPNNRFKVASPRTLDERKELARQLDRAARIRMPIVVDGMDDRMIELYRPWPNRIVVIDPRGVAVDSLPAGPRATTNGAVRLRSVLNQVLRNG